MSLISPVKAAASPQRAAFPARWAPLRWGARVALGLILAAWSLLLIAWLILQWGILPHIEQWRGPIETRASAALGVPVRIGSIEVRTSGWVPSIELRDVILLDRMQRAALRLPRVVAAVSPRSLLSFKLRFEQLYVDGPELEIRRDAQGVIRVAGLDFSAKGNGDDHAASDWFFNQGEFVVHGGAVRWVDEKRDAGPVALTDVQLVVRNGVREHSMRFDATPPAAWGERVTLVGRFNQPLLARRGDWKRWSGSVYADLPHADVRELSRHVSLPFELTEGDGAVRGWLDVKEGAAQAVTVDLALRALSMRLETSLDPLTASQVQGRLRAERRADGSTVALQRFTFVTGDGLRWPEGDLSFSSRQREGQPATGGAFTAQRLDIGLMAQVASRVPVGDALRKLLAELDPKGVATDLNARWDGPMAEPTHYRAEGELSGLTLSARPSAEAGGIGRPGLRNASLKLDASDAGGTAQVGIADGAIELPGIYDDPVVPLTRLAATLQWKIDPATDKAPSKVTVRVKDGTLANADAQGTLSAVWSTGPGQGIGRDGRYPGRLQLDSTLSHAVASRTGRYLPNGIPRPVREYVDHAVRSGILDSANFHIDGPLWDFPFATPHTRKVGAFRFAATLADVEFAYVPDRPASGAEPAWASPWPAIQHFNGDLVIDRSSLEIRQAQAELGGVQWHQLKGSIRDLDNAVLTVDGTGSGQLADMIGFVNRSPVGPWIGDTLAQATASGPADLTLALTIPLDKTDATRVTGNVTLAGNTVRLSPDTPALASAKGRVDFSENGVNIVGANVRVFGGDARVEGGTRPDGSMRFTARGNVTAEGLRAAGGSGEGVRAAELLTGQAAYRMNLGFVKGKPEVSITSNLVGMAINLPAPLAKAADTPLPLRFETTLDMASLAPGQMPRDTLRFELGPLVQAIYQRDLSGEAPRVLRGGIGVMESTPIPTEGVSANVSLATLDVDPWQKVFDRIAGGADAHVGSGGYVPDAIALRVQRLNAGARHLDKLVAGISQSDGLWRATVDADQLDGYVQYRPPRSGQGAGRVVARLARLSLPKSDSENVESLLDESPANVPALDIVVDDLNLRGKQLGKLQLEALNQQIGDGKDAIREWRLSRFTLTMPEAEFNATGTWGAATSSASPASRRRSVMDFTLNISDAGALLTRLGTPKAVRAGKGKLTGQVSWQGSPWSIDYPSLDGQIKVAIDAGQFLKVDPGAGRLLSVLSLQSVTRRLTFDFRDLFQEGFAFDNVSGDATITNGEARTNNLRMRGPQAVVLMDGSADIDHETQDLKVWVVPDVNAGAASIAYAVINPVIGLGTFLAQVVLKKQLAEAGTREFHVHGSWADPKVDTVDRKFGDDLPKLLDAPPAAASASAPVVR